MIPTKIDSISINTIREKGANSIFDWFGQHKQSFYALGWSYLRNHQQMEELFYRSILKVEKELPRHKNEASFDMWVTSIFIHTCWELSNDSSLLNLEESEQRQELFKAFDQLKKDEIDAIVLTYIKRFTREEAALLLQVSAEKIKELLFSGIQSLKKEMGNGAYNNGCKEYHKDYIDYFDRTLERSKKIDFEEHFYHCQECQEDLAAFQDVMLTMLNLPEKMEEFHFPSDFMGNIKARLAERVKHKQLKFKKRIRMGIAIASVIALLVGIEVLTGTFTKLYYTYTEEDQELRAYMQKGLGERLNLEAEIYGVKIKIKSVIADDVQTLIFYEVEDTGKENQYMIDFREGVSVMNFEEIMNREAIPRFYQPDLKSDLNKKEKNVFQGKISLLPLEKDNGTIKLRITKLQKLNGYINDPNRDIAYEDMEFKTGVWSFEIPVTKQSSKEYALNGKTIVEGIPVRFDKLTIAPTATILHYAINVENPQKRIEVANFDNLEVNNKKVKADLYGSYYSHQSKNWINFNSHFEPLFGEKPKRVNVQFESARMSVKDPKTIILDASQEYPQTFEYAGSNLSIDKVEVGQPARVVISNRKIKNRVYESLDFQVLTDQNVTNSMENRPEGILVDKNGNEYDQNKIPVAFEEIEQPRYFFTAHEITLHSDNPKENVIPARLEIYGYNTTKYFDDVVGISLK